MEDNNSFKCFSLEKIRYDLKEKGGQQAFHKGTKVSTVPELLVPHIEGSIVGMDYGKTP